jgi:flagellar biosynthesis protein FliP
MNRIIGGLAVLLVLAAWPGLAWAQELNIDFGRELDGESTGRIVQIIALITILSLAPSILVMVTSFTRIVIVLSLLRSALGLQQTPPNGVLVSLALFLTLFIMTPTLQAAWDTAIHPLIEEKITEEEAFTAIGKPFQAFMLSQVRDQDLKLFMDLGKLDAVAKPEDTPFRVLIPAFMISELKRAFEIGFMVFIPFIIIDMVVASILMSMGMMMLPPVMLSLPFKLIFFVLIDGWYLLSGSLVQSFSTG